MRKVLSLTLVFLMIFSALPLGMDRAAYAASVMPVTAPSVVLIDGQTNRIIFAKNSRTKRAPASTTKVLTAILAVEKLGLNRVVTVPSFVTSIEPSKAYLRPGERYRVRDLIRAALISSANDAAEVLGAAVAGSRYRFSKYMNEKARSIGCRHSRFVFASGLPAKNQYSTAYDMALIMRYAERYPFLVETMRTKTETIRSLAGRKIYLKSHNKLLLRGHSEIVGKTGWTRRAQHCFIGQIRLYGRKVYVALLGSHSLWRDLRTIVQYQFGVSLLKIRQNKKLWGRSDIKRIQTALKRAGYSPGPVDGLFGPQTLKAVEAFQRAKGLRADGIVGPRTWTRLKRCL